MVHRRIRVLQMIGQLTAGGAEKVVVNLANSLNPNCVDLTVTARENGPLGAEIYRPHRLIVLPKRDGFDSGHLIRLLRLVRENRIEVIHSHMFGPNLFGLMAAKITQIKIIGTIHGRDCFSSNKRIFFYKSMGPWFDQIVTVSDLLEEELRVYVKWNRVKVRTIHNGICVNSFSKPIDKLKKLRELRLPANYKVIGTVGNVRPVKGQDVVVESLKILHKQRLQDVLLVIVGEVFPKYETYKRQLDERVKALGLQDKVIFLGLRRDVDEIMKIFDVFVLPSRSEGLSLSLLEAMASARPVVATDVGMNSRVIQDEVNGLIIPPDSPEKLATAVTRILKEPGFAGKLAQEAYKTVYDQYSVEAMAKRYEAVYRAVVGFGNGR